MKEPEPIIDLHEIVDPKTGKILFAELQPDGGPRPRDMLMHNGMLSDVQDPRPAGTTVAQPVVSRLPEGRMAASSWDQIAKELQNNENGRGKDVQLLPGGDLVVVEDARSAIPISRIPADRMAALTRGPSSADVEELRRLDPSNVENWLPVSTSLLSGWSFRLRPPIRTQDDFVFLAFRSPSEGNAFRISVIRPNMDTLRGHAPHMVTTQIGSQHIPVICGPRGAAAGTLAEVRTHAAKWMAYTSAWMAGVNPRFSL